MNPIREDFKTNAPISQVPASWFNSVARFINRLMGANGVRVDKHGEYPMIYLDADAPMGTPVDNTNASQGASEPNGLTFEDWESGGGNGLKIRAYVLIAEDTGGSTHVFHPIDVEISSNGWVKSVKRVPNTSASRGAGVWING